MFEKIKAWSKHIEGHLVEDWNMVLKFWSTWLGILSGVFGVLSQMDVLSIIQTVVPYSEYIVSPKLFGWLSIVCAIGVPVARVWRQKKLALDGPKP